MASRQVYVNDLVTIDDIAQRFHMSVGQVSNIVCGRNGKRYSDFPQPIKGKKTRAVWLWPDVKDWFDTHQPCQNEAEKRALKQSKKKDRYVNVHVSAA